MRASRACSSSLLAAYLRVPAIAPGYPRGDGAGRGRRSARQRVRRSSTAERRPRSGEYSCTMHDDGSPEHLLSLEERRRLERVAVDEAGGGESEGFELAEQQLIEHASHGDEHTPSRIMQDAERAEEETEPDNVYGEGDEEHKAD